MKTPNSLLLTRFTQFSTLLKNSSSRSLYSSYAKTLKYLIKRMDSENDTLKKFSTTIEALPGLNVKQDYP